MGPNAVAMPMVAPNRPNAAPPLCALEQLLDEAEHLRHLDAGRDALEDGAMSSTLAGRRECAHEAREREQREPDDEQRLAASAGRRAARPARASRPNVST